MACSAPALLAESGEGPGLPPCTFPHPPASGPSPKAVGPGSEHHVKSSSASWSRSWRSHWVLTGLLTPHDGRGGGGVERRPRKRCWPNSKDGLGRGNVTHVLIYSTSSITLLLLLTPGDFFSCFFKSQYCHFTIPRLPLLVIKRKRRKKRQPCVRDRASCHPGGTAVLAAAI